MYGQVESGRRWLSNEMHGWNETSSHADFTLPNIVANVDEAAKVDDHRTTDQCAQHNSAKRPDSTSPVLEATPVEPKTQRPRQANQRSSVMNDRYPMIKTGRDFSDKKSKSARRFSSRAELNLSSTEPSSHGSAGKESETTATSARPRSVLDLSSSRVEAPANC